MSSNNGQELADMMKEILTRLDVQGEVQVPDASEGLPLTIQVSSPDAGRYLIGKSGQTLHALEHVTRLMWSRKTGEHANLIVDVNDYRREQATKLAQVAHDAATRVRSSGRSEALEPMSSAERRIVHTELATYNDIVTESIGQDPHRRVVIKPL